MPPPLHSPLIPHARVVPPVAPQSPQNAATTSPGQPAALPQDDVEAPTPDAAIPVATIPEATPPDATAPDAMVPEAAAPTTGADVGAAATEARTGSLAETRGDGPAAVRERPDAAGEPVPPQGPTRARRWGLAVALILASAALGVLLADPPGRTGVVASARGGDLLLLAAERGLDVEPDRALATPDAARDFVQAETGLRIQPPRLDGATLAGAGIARFADGFPVPLFVVEAAGEPVPIYAVTYAHLDAAAGSVTLARPVVNRIVARNVHVQPLGPASDDVLTALVWRNRATIYVALTDAPDDVLDLIEL